MEYGDTGGDPTSTGGRGSMAEGGSPFMVGFNPIEFEPIGYTPSKYKPMKPAPYIFTDPIEAAKRYNDFNLAQEQQAFQTGMQRGNQLLDLDTQGTINFARSMSGLQQELVASENKFNQAQRLQAVDFAMPDLRSSLDRKHGRAETYASGRLLSSAEDRAYQVAAQSASADGSFTRGFGDDSVFGRRTSDVLSAQQRLGISQMGEGLLNDWISQGSSILIDSPLKSSISQRLPSTPQILPSQQASQQQANLANLTTLNPQFGISSEINQQQFKTNIIQNTRQFNKGNRLQNNQFNAANELAKDQFNASSGMAADQFNSSGQFSAATFNAGQATNAYNRADDIQRQDAHNQAASVAADQNVSAQQSAGNLGAVGQIAGGIISAGISAFSGGLSLPTGTVTGGQSLQAVAGSPAPAAIVSGGATTSPGSIGKMQISDGGGGQVSQPTTTPSGAPTSYQGSSIPVQSSSTDRGASASDISAGYKATGGMISNLGQSGPSTPQMSALGQGLVNGSKAAESITQSFQAAATPEAKQQLVNQLHGAALSNSPSPESKGAIDEIFSQVREHLDTGVGVKGQAAGIAGFIQNYDSYNGPERARAITNISFAGQDLEANYGVKDLTSKSIGAVPIPGTNNKMTMQDALSLSNSGYNVSSLVNNWDDINEIHSTLNDKGNVLSVAATARNLGLLGSDTPEVIQQKQLSLRQAGAQPAGAWGAGAVSYPNSSKGLVESTGMITIGKTADGQSIAVPIAAAASTGFSQGVVGSGADPRGMKDMAMSTLTVSQGAGRVYENWSEDFIPKQQGQMGSSPSVANGLYKLGATDPFLFGNVILGSMASSAVSKPEVQEAAKNTVVAGALGGPIVGQVVGAVSGLFGGGNKNAGTAAREGLVATAQELGVVDQESNLVLANGQKYNLKDGEKREWHDPSQRRGDQKDIGSLHAYDVDYTKDIDGVMNVAGNALSMLMYGTGDDPYVKQMGNYFTNAAISNVGTAELTEDSYGKSQANIRGFFQSSGIETKADAYALSNQMLHEGRISQVQAVQIQQGINLAFDSNGFQAANQLLEGVKLGRKGESAPGIKEKPVESKPAKPQAVEPVAPKISPQKQVDETFNLPKMPVTDLQQPMEIQSG